MLLQGRIVMRFLLSASIAVASLISFDVYAQTCQKAPDCASLGYTKTESDCSGRTYVVCPFDTAKYSCDTTTCADLGYTDNIEECPGEYDVCQYDKTKGKCIYEASPGDLKYSFRPSDHNGWLLCDGKAYFKEQFPDLYEAIKSSYPSKLPDYDGYFIKGASTTAVANFGKPEEAGLPNITGTYYSIYSGGASEGTGAITQANVESTNRKGGTSGDHWGRLSFDASLSNPIYGKSDTVTPQNYKANVFIFAGKNLFKKVKEEGVSGKYLYSDGTVAGVYYPDKTLLGYGVTSSTVVVGGNDYVTGNSLALVKYAVEKACKEKGGSVLTLANFKKLIGNIASDEVVYPVSTDKLYFVGARVYNVTSSGSMPGATFSASDNYYYYCRIGLQ